MDDSWLDRARATNRIRTTAQKSSAQDVMSKTETPVTCKIFKAVLDTVTQILTKSYSKIAKGINRPGRLMVKKVLYLKG